MSTQVLTVPEPSTARSSVDPDTLQVQIARILKISQSLIVRPKVAHLRISYAKYLGYLQAQIDMHQMVADGTWTLKTLTGDELIEVFVSKSVWHANYSKLFPRVKNFPLLVKWLGNVADAPSNMEIFGVEKGTYTFKDLKEVLERMEEAKVKQNKRGEKGKGKRQIV